jgi:hypothetical protein
MNDACRQLQEWLDADRARPPDPAIAAHASACPVCAQLMAIDQAMRTGLAAGASLDASRQRALVDRIAPAVRAAAPAHEAAEPAHVAAPASRAAVPARRRLRRWSWVAGAAAAAAAVTFIVLSPSTFRPEQRQPASPTELFDDLLGPLADLTPPPPQAAAPADTHPSPLGPVLAALWNDFAGPVNVGLGAIKSPKPASPNDAGAAGEPSDPQHSVKKEG